MKSRFDLLVQVSVLLVTLVFGAASLHAQPTNTDVPTLTSSPTASDTPTTTPSLTPSDTPTTTPTLTPSDTPTTTPIPVISDTPTSTITSAVTVTSTPADVPVLPGSDGGGPLSMLLALSAALASFAFLLFWARRSDTQS